MLNRLQALLKHRFSKPISNDAEVRELRTLGNQYLADGDLSEAENCFRTALNLNPGDANTLICLGYTLKELGRTSDAQTKLRQVVGLLGSASEAYEATYLLGQIAEAEGDLQSATCHYLEVLKLKPDFTLACADMRRLYSQMEVEDGFPTLLKRCIAACPGVAEYRYWYGNWLLDSKQYDEAILEFDALVQLQPDFAEAHNNRGNALNKVDRIDEAMDCYNTAIRLTPTLAQAYSNRGAILMRRNQFSAAIADFTESIRLSPESAVPHINMGEAMRETRQLKAAIAHCDQAIQLDPNSSIAYWNKSLALLLSGELAQGFSLYEHRFSESRQDNKRDFTQALWSGQTSLKGKTILLHGEQGLGDTIQFCRYAPLVAAKGATVILEVQKPLVQLLQGLDGVAQVFERGHPLPSFDFHCPLLSLPYAFSTDEGTIPQQRRYVPVNAERREEWRRKIGTQTRPLVGLVWSGNSSHRNDHNRSLTLSRLIENLPDHCRYVSLQKELRPGDETVLRDCACVEHFGNSLADFADTAALCDLMDLVISVDTSVAHLAAALNKPTWILLSYSVDWRWMLDRSDSPWYPSARLYRQESLGDWDGVLQRVEYDLRKFVDEVTR